MSLRFPGYEERRRLIPALQKAIVATFDRADWKELSYQTEMDQEIEGHSRLLRSLRFEDDDYAGCVWDVLEAIIDRDPANAAILLDNPKLNRWLKTNLPEIHAEAMGAAGVPPFQPATPRPGLAVEQALDDAETLLRSPSGAPSAVDRVHTALHGYLLDACGRAGIAYQGQPSITDLFGFLRSHHPALRDSASSPAVLRILRAFATIVDALNHVRDGASLAHPNPLLGDDEAMAVIHGARALLHYLDRKVG